nr:hypothetical protein [Halogeometricum sp. CBA1124]
MREVDEYVAARLLRPQIPGLLWWNSSGSMWWTSHPNDRARSTVPSLDPESTTIFSTSPPYDWSSTPRRTPSNRSPAFLVRMTMLAVGIMVLLPIPSRFVPTRQHYSE